MTVAIVEPLSISTNEYWRGLYEFGYSIYRGEGTLTYLITGGHDNSAGSY